MARPKTNGSKDSIANLGFGARLCLAAEKLRNNTDARGGGVSSDRFCS